ncbi:hypothetical protein MMC22_001482 [Lobaria immixta]|nr:hypothetical protein [Lobaria immixta]
MTDRPTDSQFHPSQLQGAQNVHKPTAAEPGESEETVRSKLVAYLCLSRHCESTFPNAEGLDRHYKLVHRTPYDALDFEGAPLANNTIVSSAGEPSQPLSSFHPDNLAIGTPLHGPFVGHVDYHDINVNEHNGGLPAHGASSRDAFGMHQSSPSLSFVDDLSFNNEPHIYASSVVGGDQSHTPALLPFVPIAPAPTIVSPPTSLPASISAPVPPPQTPTTRALPPRRHVCPTCSKTFGRAPDMHRHARKHNPGAQRIDCPSPGCPYTGPKGFLRSDKLTSHWQNRHQ